MTNTNVNYYFLDDWNNICRQKNGTNKDFVEIIDLIELIDIVNRLSNENKELKGELTEQINRKDACLKTAHSFNIKNERLEQENEQLKSFKSRVFNLFQDEIREESELLDYYLKEKAPCNADRQQIIIGVLKRLQKELEE
mgnify:CR=1 FL=1